MSDTDNDKYDTESSKESNDSEFMLKSPSHEAASSDSEASNEAFSEQRNMEEFHSRDSETGNEHTLELGNRTSDQPATAAIQSSLPEVKKANEKLMEQTESILGGLLVLMATVSKMKDEGRSSEMRKTKEDSIKGVCSGVQYSTSEKFPSPENATFLDDKQTEETRALFSIAESAMEAFNCWPLH